MAAARKHAKTSREASPDGAPSASRGASSSGHGAAAASLRAGARPRRDARPAIYAVLDLVMALLYALVLFWLIPNRHGWAQLLGGLMVLSAATMGAAMLVRRWWPRSWWLGVAGCTALLLVALAFLVLTVISAAFLAGVYGSFGRAASSLSLVGAALVVELVALLPAFQLKYLMTRAGRASFGKEPIWP